MYKPRYILNMYNIYIYKPREQSKELLRLVTMILLGKKVTGAIDCKFLVREKKQALDEKIDDESRGC